MALPGGGIVRRGPSSALLQRAQNAASQGIRLRGLIEDDDERDVNFGLPVAGSTPDGGPPRTGADVIRDGETPVAGNQGGGRPGPGAGFAGSRGQHPSYRTGEFMDRIGGGSGSSTAGGSSSTSGQWDDYLDPQTAAWLRSLFEPTDVAALEAQARANNEAALGRAQADLEARGGMAGMGLAGGQIAMGADLQRQAAQQLTDQILGIQDTAAQRDLQRGTIASEFLDRGVQRGQEDEWMLALLEALGLGEEDDKPPTTGGGFGLPGDNAWNAQEPDDPASVEEWNGEGTPPGELMGERRDNRTGEVIRSYYDEATNTLYWTRTDD